MAQPSAEMLKLSGWEKPPILWGLDLGDCDLHGAQIPNQSQPVSVAGLPGP